MASCRRRWRRKKSCHRRAAGKFISQLLDFDSWVNLCVNFREIGSSLSTTPFHYLVNLCSLCELSFDSEEDLREHCLSTDDHEDGVVTPCVLFECRPCAFVFADLAEVVLHLTKRHRGEGAGLARKILLNRWGVEDNNSCQVDVCSEEDEVLIIDEDKTPLSEKVMAAEKELITMTVPGPRGGIIRRKKRVLGKRDDHLYRKFPQKPKACQILENGCPTDIAEDFQLYHLGQRSSCSSQETAEVNVPEAGEVVLLADDDYVDVHPFRNTRMRNRVMHNHSERERRRDIKEGFKQLNRLLFPNPYQRASNLTILRGATKICLDLCAHEKVLLHEKEACEKRAEALIGRRTRVMTELIQEQCHKLDYRGDVKEKDAVVSKSDEAFSDSYAFEEKDEVCIFISDSDDDDCQVTIQA